MSFRFCSIFTAEEIEKIKNIKLSDVLLSTNTLEEEHVPKDAFSFQNCKSIKLKSCSLFDHPCHQCRA